MLRSALITGGAGFIGSHLVEYLLRDDWSVTVVDNFDPYYPPDWKRSHVAGHSSFLGYRLVEHDIRDLQGLRRTLNGDYSVIVHLAAKAGVRPSIQDPLGYQDVNIRGTQNLLELARDWGTKQFIFASSSSVYGISPKFPWREDDPVLLPISPYAATKVSGELLGRVYSHLFGIRFVALRFFTVYGPRQRPDLAIRKFASLMLEDSPIPVYGDGTTRRDYTYIDDIVRGIRAAMDYDASDYEIINLGNNQTVSLLEMIGTLADMLDREPRLQFLPEQPGDVPQTWADLRKASQLLNYRPSMEFRRGVQLFGEWLRSSRDVGNAEPQVADVLATPDAALLAAGSAPAG